MKGFIFFYFCFSNIVSYLFIFSTALDTISNDNSIKDGHTIVSAGGNFELGFFSPGNSKNRYIGIWYKNLPKGREVVWVANRVNPLNDTSGILTVSSKGIVLLNGNQDVIWSSNSSRSLIKPVAQLLDTGNLVLKDNSLVNKKDYAWQSFDYPDSTLLPGMKLGLNLVTGKYWTMSSWKSSDDPSPGAYLDRLDTSGYPQFFVWEGPAIKFSSGIWNGHLFVGGPNLKPNPYYTFEFVNNDKEIYYKYELINTSLPSRLVLNPAGLLQRLLWIERNQNWFLYSTGQMDNCDRYALCGQFARCNINDSPPCDCLRGFQPKNQQEWDTADWSSGCVRRTPLTCGTSDRFLKYSSVKLPDTRHSWFDKSIGLEECQRLCLKNCSCTAYSNLDVKNGGSGCLLWFKELVDIREYAELDQDLYVRMAASELGSGYMGNTRISVIAIILTVSAIILVGFLFWFAMQRMKGDRGVGEGKGKGDMELPLFDVMTISAATNNFSSDNIIGEGGFGSVYRGKLSTGPEIAVKKLSKHSGQGFEELKNEVVLISKLQHRNLVRLLGCCLEGEERMLIYEYMPNNSLDFFIFDECRKRQLPWENRFRIAMGISRGILYLHQDSRLRIIHRDLKTSNILLDSEWNPKISDFGLARIIGCDQNEARTKRVIGTYGYMSPEYAVDGKFSVKSDVFSLGVLLLEIVSGRKNRTFRHPDHHHSLIGHAWLLWNEGKALELIDDCLKESFVESQVLRCVHVALLCVQRLTDERPTMSSVVFMLSHEEVALPQPKEPGFFIERSIAETDDSNEKRCISDNVLTLTILQPR
ncbi:G-type lectin S-receptor-like serine/threonine-protein kinase At4g27290 [Solanum lycopersicum]|uniref:G-type lectin S-receptor-like serine/threonine-protein kinase At4g27290 n=1 Tax=Solanum lycopersicum TaxID=4081 RepID=UPI000532A561|nr:G-type lectin S-receptor-like serine/threonine-protein kinase At4g27290 [Solanum lycopersicum]